MKLIVLAFMLPAAWAFQRTLDPVELIASSARLHHEGKAAEALQVINQVLAMPGLPPLIISLGWNEAGLVHHSQGEHAAAVQAYLKAKTTLEAANLETPLGYRVKMNLIALYIETEQLEKARSLFAGIDLSRLQRQSDISQALSLKASFALSQNDLARARAGFLDQVEYLRKSNRPELQIDLATALNNLGFIASRSGNWEEADRWVSEALETQRRVSTDRHRNSLTMLCGLATVRVGQKRYTEAVHLWEQAMGIAEATLSRSDSLIPAILQHYADALAHVGRKAEAKAARKQARERALSVSPPLPVDATVALSDLLDADRPGAVDRGRSKSGSQAASTPTR